MAALEGETDYEVIFIPWYWQEEYQRDAPANNDYSLSEEEEEYKKLYSLNDKQIFWRRTKIATLKSEWKFRQEYPAFLQEAFQTSGNTLIHPEAIMKARKSEVKDQQAPLVVGVDPARNGDRTVIIRRRGRQVFAPEVYKFGTGDTVQMLIAGKLAQIIDRESPQKVFIDVGHGYGVIDRLKELGYGQIVEGIHFGSSAMEDQVYMNKRVEMWCAMRDFFHGEDGEVSIPDDDELQRDLMSMPGEGPPTSSGKVRLESKAVIRKNLGMSPDIGDALALTFAYPIKRQDAPGFQNRFRKKNLGKSGISTLQRVRRSDKVTTKKMSFWA